MESEVRFLNKNVFFLRTFFQTKESLDAPWFRIRSDPGFAEISFDPFFINDSHPFPEILSTKKNPRFYARVFST
ncbi:hypothetical protein EFP84_02485 [Leptospira kmetyi]|uniref:Uncharacterized protein n=1 Tax=Leptospira kmetyi TaxID=408139 RepID=A0AAD0ULE3_9LEPT|nr:hypothetical protein EFP84_02485 [Leptospira kmetyi]